MVEAPFIKLIRWHDQGDKFFALFLQADDGKEDDGVVLRLIEEFFFTFFSVHFN